MNYRVVLDTNQIIAAGSTWVMLEPITPDERNEAQQLIHEIATNHTGLISSRIAAEYLRKLMDKGHPYQRTTRYIGFLLGAFEQIEVTSTACSPSPSDPDDVVFLLCSIDGDADFLVSEDSHLLVLRDSYIRPRILPRSEASLQMLGTSKTFTFREKVMRHVRALRRRLRGLANRLPKTGRR